jgi:hypothetical protein
MPEPDVESELIDLAVGGLVRYGSGGLGGWGITEAGRAADARGIAEELEAAGARNAVQDAFDLFGELNPELLDLCTAWQLRSDGGALRINDHKDRAYDARVLSRLAVLDRRAEVVCGRLSAALERFRPYRSRLADALAQVQAGQLDYVAEQFDSYHTVWFQLHEDLLSTLGMPRT